MFELRLTTIRKLTSDELREYVKISPFSFPYELYVEAADDPTHETILVYHTEDADTEIEVRRCE